ncbi:MAG: CDP-diacylglycerol--glycerol-3-phosphate 3-phosphatidyltransferase [Clostridia bacterium]
MNLPNSITLGRVVAIPFFMYFLYTQNYFVALIIFSIASISDFVDGYLARKMNLVTNFGKFMDPTADKLLVYSAMIIFCEVNLMSSIFVTIIISRDFIINTLRSIAVEKGMVIPAMWSGKVKTVVQMVGIILIMLLASFENGFLVEDSFTVMPFIYYTSVIMTIITIYSGIDYIIRMKDVFLDN